MPPKAILITGVYGLIAGAAYTHLAQSPDQYEVYGLARRRQTSDRVPEGRIPDIPDNRFILSDLSDLKQLQEVFANIHTVVHMAADPRPEAPWESILHSNIQGTYNVFEAARLAGVKRILYASSGQATLGYRLEEPYKAISEGRYDNVPDPIPQITRTSPTRPMNIYGASKVWGEGLARTYADVHGLSSLVLRIGWVVAEDQPPTPITRDVWCSQRDIVQLIECCINAPESLRYDIFYGMNDDRYRWVDIDHARKTVGFNPQDRAADFLE
ncbi:MAG: NAD(P)-dependent oxidoreductase [bacterium]|nr:NAD(P)-dependent oxidoreductase [bacterium]